MSLTTINQYEKISTPVAESNEYLTRHTITGDFGEDLLLRMLRNSGYIARNVSKFNFQGDIEAIDPRTGEIIKIEVKTANENPRTGRYSFCLRKPGKTDCNYSDFCALVCIDKNGIVYLYIAQCSCFNDALKICISSHPTKYSGKYAAFRYRSPLVNFDAIRDTCALWSGLPC